jgi:hypothetical protein
VHTKLPYLTLAAIFLLTFVAKATPEIVYTLPMGALTVITPEPTEEVFSCAPTYIYSASANSSYTAPNPIIDLTAQLSICRYYQTTSDGGFAPIPTFPAVLGTPATPSSTTWDWGSGSTNSHPTIEYTSGQVGADAQFYYGREILQLLYTPGPGNGAPSLLDTQIINIYPWIGGSTVGFPTAAFSDAVTSAFAGSNPSPYAIPYPSPYPTFQEPPRFIVRMNNLYPTGISAVCIYAGTPSQPIGTPTTIPVTAVMARSGGLWKDPPGIIFATAPYVNTSATTYTIVALQWLPASGYAAPAYPTSGYALNTTPPLLNPAILNTVTFTVTSASSVNATVGTVK